MNKNIVFEKRFMRLLGWEEFGVSGLHHMEQN